MNRPLRFLSVYISFLLFGLVLNGYSQCPTLPPVNGRAISNTTNGVCSAVATEVSYTVNFDSNTPSTGQLQLVFFWGDGGVDYVELTEGLKDYVGITGTHNFPTNSDCEYFTQVMMYYNGSACTDTYQTRTIDSYRTEQYNQGLVQLLNPSPSPSPTPANVIEVCQGVDISAVFNDMTNFNCNATYVVSYPVGQTIVNPNTRRKWIQLLYNTKTTAGSRIPNVSVGGVPVTGAGGADIINRYPDSRFPSGVKPLAAPVIYNDPRRPTTELITATGGFGTGDPQVGDIFEVTIRYWNVCNPYSNNTSDPDNPVGGDYVNGDNAPIESIALIKIVSAPAAPTTSNLTYCNGTTPAAFTISGVPSGATVKWYADNAGVAGSLITSNTASTGGVGTLPIASYPPSGITNTTAGVYTVWASYLGASASQTCESPKVAVVRSIRENLVQPGTITNPSGNVFPVCAGTTGITLTAGATGPSSSPTPIGGSWEYLWTVTSGLTISGSANNQTVTIDVKSTTATGNQTVTVVKRYLTNDNATTPSNCVTSSRTFTIGVSALPVGGTIGGGTTPLCLGASTGTMTLSGHSGTISKWQVDVDGGGFTDIANTTTTYSEIPAAPGVYTYRAVLTSGSCTPVTSGTRVITVNPRPDIATISGGATVCSGTATNLQVVISGTSVGLSPYTVVLADGGTGITVNNYVSGVNISVSPAVTTTYTITSVTDARGCTVVTRNGSATVNIGNPISATISGAATICPAASTNLSIAIVTSASTVPPYTVVYKANGVTQPTINNYNSGDPISVSPSANTTYTLVSVTDAAGCTATTLSGSPTVNVGATLVSAALSGGGSICKDQALNLFLTINGGVSPYSVTIPGINGGTAFTYANGDPIAVPTGTVGTTNYSATIILDACGASLPFASISGNPQSVTVNALPTVTGSLTPSVCSTSSGGNTSVVDLTTLETSIYSGAGTITWYTGYNSGTKVFTGAIASPSSATVTNGVSVFAKVVDSPNGCISPATVTYTVNATPSITTQPVAAVQCSGLDVTYSVVANGTSLSYQWQEKIGSGSFADINLGPDPLGSGMVFANTTSASLSITNVVATTPARQYRVIVTSFTGSTNCQFISNAATLTVNPLPVVTSQTPSVCSDNANGTTATVNLTAQQTAIDGTSNRKFEWFESYNASTKTFSNLIGTPTGYLVTGGTPVFVRVTNLLTGCVSPATVTYTVNPKADLAAFPSSASVCAGDTQTFTATASGPGLSFQWQENGVNISNGTFAGGTYSGALTNQLTISGVTAAINGKTFSVVAFTTGSCSITTPGTVLTVNPLPTVVNVTPAPCSDVPGGTQAVQNLTVYNKNTGTNTGVSAGAGTTTTVSWWVNYSAGTFSSPIASGSSPGNDGAYTVNNGDVLFAKVVDNATGCISMATATFTVKPRPFDNEIRDGNGTTIATVATSGADYNLCASGNSILFQTIGTTNPGSTFTWTVPPTSYTNEFSFGGSVGKNAVFEFSNYTEGNPSSLYQTTGIPITVTETLNGCTGNPITIHVHVLSAPAAPTISGDTYVCEGGIANYSVPVVAGTSSYDWKLPIGATFITAFPGTSAAITVQMGANSGNVTLTTANAICPSPASAPFPVVVSPNPAMNSVPQPVAVCSGENINSQVTLSATIPGSTFNWKVLAVAGSITGVNTGDFANNVTDINQTPTNVSGVGASITYQVTPLSPDIDPVTAGTQSCSGSPLTFTVGVNPVPVLIASQSKTICNNQAVNKEILLTPTNLPSGTVFSWPDPDGAGPATAKTIAMGTSGTLHITDILTNATDNPLVVTYHVTPTNGLCTGTAIDIPITVEPTPQVGSITNNSISICSGGTPDIIFTTPTVPTNPSNLKFDVVLKTLPTGVLATGVASSGVTDVTASPSYQFTGGTLVNNNATNRTVVYTITAKLTGCASTSVDVNVIVEPTPQVAAANSSPRICNGDTPNFTISSSTISSDPTELTYDIVPTIPAGITATGNASAGIIGLTHASLPFNFTGGTLTNATDSRITVSYEVIPKLNNCNNGPSQIVNVVVEPSPKANTPTNLAPVICSGDKPNFSFTTPTIPNTPSDLTFDVSVGTLPTGISGTGIAITGVTGVSASASTAYVFNSGTLTNSGTSAQTVVYTIIPKLNGCADGATQTVNVVVQPVPVANVPNNASPVICNGGTPNFSFTTPTVPNTVGDLTFDITLNTPLPTGVTGTGLAITGVTGVTADAITPYVFTGGTLSNSEDDFKTITYTITPKLNGCSAGSTRTVTVKIEPTPKADAPVNSAPVICNGGTTNFSFTSPTVTTTQSDLTFDVAANLPLPSGVTGSNLSVTGVSASSSVAYVFNNAILNNASDSYQTVTFTITPKLNGCANGPVKTVDVKVEPTPRLTFTNSAGTICNGGTPNISVVSPTAPVTPSNLTFDVAVTLNGVTGTGVAVNGLTGTTAPFFINSGTLVNNSNTAKTVKYTVTPKLNGCANGTPQDILVVVEPTPAATTVNHIPRVCNGGSPNIEVNTSTVPSGATPMTFDVTVNLNGVTGTLDAGNGITGATGPQFFINTGTLTNSTNSSKTVTYTITPKLGGCANGTAITVDVIVEPTPAASFTNIAPTICNGGTPNVLITSTTSPSNSTDLTFDVVAVLPTGITGTLRAGNGVTGVTAPFSINTGVLTNSNNSYATIEYQIIPKLNGCPSGSVQSVFVIVEPTPTADDPINNKPVICNGGTPDLQFTSPTTVSVPSNLTFDVTVITLPAGVSGTGDAVSGKSGATAPFFINTGVLTNSNNSAKTVVYRITPKLNGCTNGPTKDVSVIVEPTPVATFTNTKPTICSQDVPSITITSPTVPNTPGDLKFDIAVSIPTGITGTGVAFNGITNVSSGYVLNTGTLVHDNLSNTPLVVTYTITPRLINGNNCADGTPVQVNVTVRPKPVGVSSTTASPSREVCSGETFTYDIQGDNIDALGNQVASKFTFTVTSSDETNVSTPAALDRTVASTTGITGAFTNKTNADVFITYHITPFDQSAQGCAGAPFDVVALIHPEPKGPSTTTIERCSGIAINYDIQTAIDNTAGGGNALANTQFTYVISSVLPNGNDLTPAAFPGNFGRSLAGISDAPIPETFRNFTDHDVTISYTITPYSADPNRCVGTPFELKVVYHPEPVGTDLTDPLCATTLNHDIQTQITNSIPSEFTYTVTSDNVAVPAGPDRTVFSTAAITDVYVNNSGMVANMTYTITARALAAPQCGSTTTPSTFKYVARIFPTPIATGATLTATCSDIAVTIIPQTFVTNGVTIDRYDWKVTYPTGLISNATLPASNTTTTNATGNISFTMTNKTAGQLSVTFEITPYSGSCPGPVFTVVKPIDAEPVMSNSLNNSQCSGDAYGLNLATNGVYAAGTVTFDVYVDDVPVGLTGGRTADPINPIGGGNSAANVIFNDSYINNTAAPLIVKYRVIPRGGGCEGDAKVVEFTVKPSPVLQVAVPPAMCSTNTNSASSTNIVLGTDGISVNAGSYRIDKIEYARSPVSGSMDPFTLTPSSSDFTVPAANKDAGDIGDINLVKLDQFTNKTADPFVVRYTVTPISAGGCEGVQGTVSITVNPEPILETAIIPAPCSGDKIDPTGTAFELKSITTSVASTLFIIRSINTNGLTAGTSNAPLGVQINKDGIDNDTYVNTISPSFINVVYTITPISADGCMGVDRTVTVRVNPAPGLRAGLDKLVCNDASSGITLADNSPTSAAASQYRLAGVTVSGTPITPGATVAGLTANASNTATGTTGNTSMINADKYTNTTSDRIVVRYEIVAIASTGCEATGFINLTIEPSIVSTSIVADSDICSGTPIALTFNTSSYANGDLTNPVLTYSYSMVYVAPATTGITGNTVGNNLLKDASGTDVADVLVNSTNSAITVNYKITPRAIAAAGGLGCAGTPQLIPITIQPRPKINAIADKTVCENSAINLNLVSPTQPSTGVIKFRLTSVTPETAAVTGFTPANTLLANNTVLGDVLSNTDVVQRYVDYTFEPVNVDVTNAVICANGLPITVRVTVNPRPEVSPQNPADGTAVSALEICSSESIEINLPTDTDPASTLVKWTVLASSVDVVGESNGAGDVLFQTLLNKGTAVQTVDYTITPSFNLCDGPSKHILVTVNPTPSLTVPNKLTICDGTPFVLKVTDAGVVNTSSSNTTMNWVVDDVNEIGTSPTEFDGSGTEINQSFTAYRSKIVDGSATLLYQITPVYNGGKQCEGIPKVVNVSVAPQITASIDPVDEICEGTPVFLVFELGGQAPFDFVYSATDATGTVSKSVAKSGNVKVEKVTPTLTTTYKVLSIKDALGCPVTFPAPEPSQTVTVYKKVVAGWTANIPPFVGGSASVQYTNTSTPVDGSTFNYEWTFGTDGYVNPLTSTEVAPGPVIYTRPGDHYVSLVASNKFAPVDLGCESTYSAKITIPVLPLFSDFTFDPKAACFPQEITITSNSATGPAMDWTVKDSNGRIAASSTAALPVFQITSPGKYTITLRTYDPFTNAEAYSPTTGKDFTIYDNPVASFDVRPNLVYVPDTELSTFNFSTGAPEYLWDFGDGGTSTEPEPKYTYKVEGIYDITLIAINDHGDGAVCKDTLSQKVTAKQGGVTKVPNAFTPSTSGPSGGVAGNNTFNDVFLPIVKGAEEFNMQIFDRWGNLIFESNNSNIGWDGYDKNGKLLPAGVYVYKLTIRLSDGQRTTQLGDITMIR